MKNNKILLFILFITISVSAAFGKQMSGNKIDLSGDWEVKYGENSGRITLPGTLDSAGLGATPDTLSMSRDEKFRRLTRRHSFIGQAHYSREIEIPKQMAGHPLRLDLGRVIWKSSLKIDGVPVSSPDDNRLSLATPHHHFIPEGLSAGKHTLEIEIDNSEQRDISFSRLAHAYTNDTQVIWNGILGDISISVIPDRYVKGIRVYPSANLDSMRIVADFRSSRPKKGIPVELFVDGKKILKDKVSADESDFTTEWIVPASNLSKWDEFSPNLHQLSVRTPDDEKSVTFGMRHIDNKQGIRINGNPVSLRGTLECCVFPLTGTPPMDKEGWMKTFSTAREWGLNHLRFHSWCPPEAAFEVADSMGFYLQVELPVWSLKIGDSEEVKEFLRDEFENIVENYGNHPSLCLLSIGNELQYDFNFLNEFAAEMKRKDSRRLYTTTSYTFEKGHGVRPEPSDDYFITQQTADGWVRGQGVFEKEPPRFDKNYNASMGCVGVPLVTHEIGQYAVYPSMKEIEKYTGTLDPLNFKTVREDLRAKGLLDEADEMTRQSARLAAILYKEEIERALKTQGISGYQLLGLNDFPGQGTALVGLLDAFWDSKGAVDAAWFRQMASPVVPLLSFGSPLLKSGETFEADALISNFGPEDISGETMLFEVRRAGNQEVIFSQEIPVVEAGRGGVSEIGGVSFMMPETREAEKLVASLTLGSKGSNSWNLWLYPSAYAEAPTKAEAPLVTDDVEEATKAAEEGRNVLLTLKEKDVKGIRGKFLPVFWSPVHFPDQAGTMGVMCNPEHPALKLFPNDGHTDWQWWRLLHDIPVANLDSMPEAKAIVRGIDNFVHNRRLAYVYETRVGKGKIVVTTLPYDIDSPYPEIAAMSRSLLHYAGE